jgi:hypothetical protein
LRKEYLLKPFAFATVAKPLPLSGAGLLLINVRIESTTETYDNGAAVKRERRLPVHDTSLAPPA